MNEEPSLREQFIGTSLAKNDARALRQVQNVLEISGQKPDKPTLIQKIKDLMGHFEKTTLTPKKLDQIITDCLFLLDSKNGYLISTRLEKAQLKDAVRQLLDKNLTDYSAGRITEAQLREHSQYIKFTIPSTRNLGQ